MAPHSSPTKRASSHGTAVTNSPSRAPFSSLVQSLNSVSINSPTRLKGSITANKDTASLFNKSNSSRTGSKDLFSSAPQAAATRRSKSSPSKTTSSVKSRVDNPFSASTHEITGVGSTSRRSSPVKTASLAAGGGIGRNGVVTHDFEATTTDSRKSPSKKGKHLDRYIPSRSSSANGSGEHTGPIMINGSSSANNTGVIADANDTSAHTADLSNALGVDNSRRILSFFAEPPMPQTDHAASALMSQYARLPNKGSAASSTSSANAATRRRIATAPERVLDAPGLLDDYYLNLLDWSSTNLVAIGLGESVYVWNAETGDVNLLCSVGPGEDTSASLADEGDDYICSLKFTEDGSHLAVGLSSGPIQVYDVCAGVLVRTMSGHLSRVPALSWSGAILSSGCRTGEIWNSDVRVAEHRVAQMRGHRGEVCGLEWRAEMAGGLSGGGQGLLASGGNDNVVNVWDGRMTNAPKMSKTNHTAAVKALAWCPWNSSLLASGGGTSDKTIHFWNTTTSARLNSLITPSQVTSLVWSPHSKEIMSSHGIPDHQLSIWSYPSLSKVTDIPNAHETRILHSCLSPDGTTVATASSDENLKFWKVFDVRKGAGGAGASGRGPIGAKDVDADHGIQKRSKTGMSVR